MTLEPSHYETVLSLCTQYQGALEMLRRYRPYLEIVPSMRRPQDSIVTLPLPNARVRATSLVGITDTLVGAGSVITLPCDVALLMCDPEWKIKTGTEIVIFIHRPQEDFSQLLMRWRRTERLLEQGYEWLLPKRFQHLLSDSAEVCHPLFVVFPQTPAHILKGLQGATLPVVVYPFEAEEEASDKPEDLLGLEDIPELAEIDPDRLDLPESES